MLKVDCYYYLPKIAKKHKAMPHEAHEIQQARQPWQSNIKQL